MEHRKESAETVC